MLASQLDLASYLAAIAGIVAFVIRFAKAKFPELPRWSPPLIASVIGFALMTADRALGGTELADAAWFAGWGLLAGPLASGVHELAKGVLDPLVGETVRVMLLGRLERKVGDKSGMSALLVVLALGLGLVLGGCNPAATRAQVVAANTIAAEVDTAAAKVAKRWEEQGDQIVGLAESGEASVDQAAALLLRHEDRYRQVWAALDLVAGLHAVWVQAIEDGEASVRVFLAMARAYCEATELVPELAVIAALPCSRVDA
jgi:hypothetical protein